MDNTDRAPNNDNPACPPAPPAAWIDGYVLANGIRIHYWRSGGSKPALLMTHGFSDDGLCWTNFAKEFEADLDVILPDARGHGLSDPPTPADGPDAQCEDLAGLIRELGLQKPIVMGHSMGSASVAWFAARYPDVPRAVILEDPRLTPWLAGGPRGPATDAEIDKRRARVLAQNNRSQDELVAECLQQNPHWGRSECEYWARSKRLHHPNTVAMSPGKRPPMSELLTQITAPTLILKADAQGADRQQNEEVAALLAKGQLVHVEGAGHCVRRDRMEGSLRVLRAFLEEV